MVRLDDAGEGGVDFVELGEELFQDLAAFAGEFVKAFLAVVFLAPFALEEALAFETAEEGIKGAFVDLDAEFGELLSEGVAIMFAAELGEDGDNEKAAAKLEAETGKKIGIWFGCHYQVSTLCDTQCVLHSRSGQESF